VIGVFIMSSNEEIEDIIKNKDIVYKEFPSGRKRRAIKRECKYCGETFKATISKLKKGEGKFCSKTCVLNHNNKIKHERLVEDGKEQAKDISWNNKLAYLTGLITSDGHLNKERPRIIFTSSDKELINHVQEIVSSYIDTSKITPQKLEKGGSRWWKYQFTSYELYYFLQNIGIHPNKSKTINQVDVPDRYFKDFLRGEIDGDGGFYLKGEVIQTQIFSGSKKFLIYLKEKINNIITKHNKGSIYCEKDRTHVLSFSLYDTLDIYNSIYDNAIYYLSRKRNIPEEFFKEYNYNKDKMKSRRQRSGGNGLKPGRKLSVRDSISIIKKYYEKEYTYKQLASIYDVSFQTISNVINLNHWTAQYLVK